MKKYIENAYENDRFIVTDNGSDELIIRLKEAEFTSIRVTPDYRNINVVSQTCEPRLYHINGLLGLTFGPRK